METFILVDFSDGVTFIAAGRISSHFLYGNENMCVSNNTTVTVKNAPAVVILITNGNELRASVLGISYQWYLNGHEILNSNQATIIATSNGNYVLEVNYASGCSKISNAITITTLDTENEKSLFQLTGYPNPTVGDYHLNFGNNFVREKILITVFDDLGRKVKQVDTVVESIIQL